MEAIAGTHFQLPGQTSFYKGKVRDVYSIGTDKLVMVATDRISAFDVVLPRSIPYKGQVLNLIAASFLEKTKDIVRNWVIDVPHPNVTIGHRCEPFKVEMVIRGYLSGHAARTYASGRRELCGVALPEGLRENDRLSQPIITPTTKASVGHDEDISREEIIRTGIVSANHYEQLEQITRQLFLRGTEIANSRGLILVDTKYEFGLFEDEIVLMDEIHTPDSSRYFYADTYEELQLKQLPQRQLSKEFVRQWLIEHGFMGKPGQTVPEMTDAFVSLITDRYIELYEHITGLVFHRNESRINIPYIESIIIEKLKSLH
ncbi:MAG: phosphoribosylaminoimidazolesuccinocarboxamide synthase [Bacteroidetes bacterium]|nr:phosphoribosylaminoimidazolesuccinocarboxamide synthase [Bacteroidota bacterium]